MSSTPMRMAVVGSSAYFEDRGRPCTLQDLMHHHRCINLRLPTRGNLYAWEFEKAGRELNVRVECQMVFNNTGLILKGSARRAGPRLPAQGPGAAVRRGRPV